MSDDPRPKREPAINAPWPALALVALIAGSYVVQGWAGEGASGRGWIIDYGFAPSDLDDGRLWTLVTHLFLHGGWPHVAMNAVMALAFAPPVSRLLGAQPMGAGALLVFYLVCGVAGALAYAAVHPHDALHRLVGASGAVAGLMGAACRLLHRRDSLAPVLSRPVLTFTAVWVVLNIVLGLIGFAPGMGRVAIAWEAHLGGYFAGLLLIGPLVRGLRRI